MCLHSQVANKPISLSVKAEDKGMGRQTILRVSRPKKTVYITDLELLLEPR